MVSDMKHITQQQLNEVNKGLELVAKDTISCWIATRINGASASMACDGNISIPLLRLMDEVKNKVEEGST